MSPRLKLVFLSPLAVPHQIKFCSALQEYYDAEFWFYETPDRTRGKWWRIDLGDKCKILKNVLFMKSGPLATKYFALGLNKQLNAFNPDIVMLGGFSIPSNVLAFFWARRNKKRTIVFTERSRHRNGVLRKRGVIWRTLKRLYRDLDMVYTTADDAVEQFRDDFAFGDKVVAGRYAADIENYFKHPLREPKPAYTYLFANRMTEIYNPLGAIDIFAAVLLKYPGSQLVMNAAGELGPQCRVRIKELGLYDDVEFLTGLQSWEDLHKVYSRCDILLLPASFSNGNFTILEAMASGMGLVISNCVLGIGKMVEDGKNGFNCAPTKDAFVSCIDKYVQQPSLLKVHAELNRPLVEPLSASGTAKFFNEILQERFGY